MIIYLNIITIIYFIYFFIQKKQDKYKFVIYLVLSIF